MTAGGKQTFDQAFKLDKPEYNDIWAGILLHPIASSPINAPRSLTLYSYPHLPQLCCRLWHISRRLLVQQVLQQGRHLQRGQYLLSQYQHRCTLRLRLRRRFSLILGLLHTCSDFYETVHLDNGYPTYCLRHWNSSLLLHGTLLSGCGSVCRFQYLFHHLLRKLDTQDPVQRGHAAADYGCGEIVRARLPSQRYWWYRVGGFWCLVLPHARGYLCQI